MYDMHYNLLTILYFNFIKNNKYSDLEKLIDSCQKIYKHNNIIGGIINLSFMNEIQMLEQLDIDSSKLTQPIEMFKESIEFLNNLKELEIIPQQTDFIYGIEGYDYFKTNDLNELYKNGLRVITPIYNNENIYSSNEGLTQEGENLIKESIDLNIGINISNTNKNTFYDIVEIVKNKKKENPIIIASNSNIKRLTDNQINQLNEIGAYISLLTNTDIQHFLKYIDYLTDIIKYDKNKIIVSTNNINLYPNQTNNSLETFNIFNINKTIRELLYNKYDEQYINDILVNNPKTLIKRINKKEI